MKVVNPHSLFDEEINKIIPNLELSNLFNMWKKLMNEKSDEDISLFDAFVGGYFIGCNYTLREKFNELIKIENFDNRLQSPLHEKRYNVLKKYIKEV